jgi:hemerythrin-like metal-binding protein
MPFIEWKEQFSTGIKDVDYEHRELIDLINKLYENLSSKSSELTIMGFLGEIEARISAHFALEESIMRDLQYDEYEDHKADHERLLEEIRDIMDDYEDQTYFDEETLAKHMSQWFSEHFQTKDSRFHTFLN